MPVELPKNEITPYTSTVPLVNIPPEVIGGTRPSPPLQGQFKGKATSEWVLGDSLLKGFMQGHQINEQKKYAQATATINAADAASEAAYQQYQDALTKAGGNDKDPAAQAAYQSYVTTFNAGKQAKAQFVMPEKGQKGKKAATGSDSGKSSDGKKKQASAGFNSIRDFFEANPHIVPQIALMTMQPKPPGLSPQRQEQSLQLQGLERQNREGQRIEQAQKIYDTGAPTFSSITDPETLPPESKKDYETWIAAKNILYPMKETGKDRIWTNGKDFISLTPGQAPPAGSGYYPYEKGPTQGSDAELENKYLASIGVTRQSATTEQLAAATQYARSAKIPQTKTDSTSEVTPQGVHKGTTIRTASPGAIQRLPAAPQQAPTASAGPTPSTASGAAPKDQQAIKKAPVGKSAAPPITKAPGGKETWGTTGRAIKFNSDRSNAAAKAKEKYNARITTGVEMSPDGTKTKIDPITAARMLAEDQNNIDRDYRTQMRTAKQPPGDIYVYRIDPNTGAALEPKKVPDENTVNVLRKYATQHNKTLETLTDDEIESVLATEKKLGPPPGSQPETQTYGGHTYKLNPKTKQYDRVKETSQ